MLGIEPGSAVSGSKYANHCAMLLTTPDADHGLQIIFILTLKKWQILKKG